MIVHNKICYLLVQLIRIWKERGFDTDTAAAGGTDTDSIHAVTAYIDTHAGEAIKVEARSMDCL